MFVLFFILAFLLYFVIYNILIFKIKKETINELYMFSIFLKKSVIHYFDKHENNNENNLIMCKQYIINNLKSHKLLYKVKNIEIEEINKNIEVTFIINNNLTKELIGKITINNI